MIFAVTVVRQALLLAFYAHLSRTFSPRSIQKCLMFMYIWKFVLNTFCRNMLCFYYKGLALKKGQHHKAAMYVEFVRVVLVLIGVSCLLYYLHDLVLKSLCV